MFIVIYSFKPKPNKEADFINLWNKMTTVIFENCNSLGSRLHKSKNGDYIAYAQWPDEATFQKAKIPEKFHSIRNKFRESISSSTILHKLEMVDDLLK